MNKREAYYHLRHAYRLARRTDQAWKSNPRAARNSTQARPDTAGKLLAILPARHREAIASRPAAAGGRLAPGPRARQYLGWKPGHGLRSNLNLYQRAALRRALIKKAEFEESLRPFSHETSLPLMKLTFWIEGGNMRLAAENARMRSQRGR